MRHEEDSMDQSDSNHKLDRTVSSISRGSISCSSISRGSISRGSISRGSSSSSLGGGLNKELENMCAICLNRIHDPYELLCKHLFCRSCFSAYREARGWLADRCPLCRRPLDGSTASPSPKGGWVLKLLLMMGFITLSMGPFYLLLNYW